MAEGDEEERSHLRRRVARRPTPRGRIRATGAVRARHRTVSSIAEWATQHRLTPAELRVTEHSVRGLSNKEIAHALGISPATVRSHLESICRKLGIGSRGELAHLVYTAIESATASLADERRRLIEELERERATLERERALLDATLAQSPLAIVVAEAETRRIVLANDEARQLLGGEIPANVEAFRERLPLHDEAGLALEANAMPLARALEGHTTRGEAIHRAPNGERRHFEFAAAPIRVGETIKAALIALLDVTAHRRAEDERRATAAHLRIVAETVPSFIFSAHPDGRVEHANPELAHYAGVVAGEPTRWRWQSLVHPDDRDQVALQWEQACRGATTFEARFRLRRVDGVFRWCLGRASPSPSRTGELWLVAFTDIEDLARAEDRAQQALRSREELMTVLSRDLAGPAAMLLRFAENLAPMLAALDDPRALAAERTARLVASSAKEMSALLTDVCLLGELDTGRCIIRAEHVSPAALVEHSMRQIVPALTTEAAVEASVGSDLPLVVVDPVKMRSVFRPLLARAVSVSPPGAKVAIVARAVSAAEVEFRVTDAGPPLTPLEQHRLFDRSWLATVGKRNGLGLELLIARRIIECHFGRLWITSGDEGTTFHFTIPSS